MTEEGVAIITSVVNVATLVGTIVGVVGLFVGVQRTRRLRQLTKGSLRTSQGEAWEGSFPYHLTRPLNFREYRKLLTIFSNYLEKVEQVEIDAYVGVNVSGMAVAAELVNAGHYHPLLHMAVRTRKLDSTQEAAGGNLQAYGVVPRFDLEEWRGKTVLVVDNAIRTGHTLLRVVEVLTAAGINVVTMVAYLANLSDGQKIEPNYVLMRAAKGKRFDNWLQ